MKRLSHRSPHRARWATRLVLAAAVGFGLAGGAIAQTTPDTSRPADAGSARGPAKAGAPTAPAKPSTGPAEASTSTGSLNDQLARLAKLEFELERALASAQLDVASARRRFESAQQRLDAASDPSDLLRDEVAARRLELESAQRVASLIQGRIDRRDDDEQRWRHLYALEDGSVSPEHLAEWLSQAETARDELSREATVKGDRLAEVRRDRQYTSDQIEGASPESTSTRWTRVRLRALEQLDRGYEADLANLDDSIALNKRLLERIRRAQEDLPISARLRGAMHYLREAWNYPLTGSEPEPITLGKVVGALVIFVIGWLLARTIARLLGARVFPGLKMEAGAAAAFESLAFYVLLLVVFLTALRMVQIPLTAFAVVGGALAIGVGFGSQTVVNNFISGIILLAERPIKRGDLVDVGGVFGNIEQIGLRSTRVRTGDNIHIIVPNASFLETNVVNWTLSDARVRLNIPVGVAYGSPTREVERLILEAVRDQPTVLREPAPVVLFVDFGDNALGFEARFWIEMRTVLARLRTESEIRFRIDELFREAGITIAFPQRDVHLDSLSPVEVRLVDESRTRVEPGDDDAVDREA